MLDPIYLGRVKIKDTLEVRADGLHFEFEEKFKVLDHGIMSEIDIE